MLVIGGSSWYSQIQYMKMREKEALKAEQERKDREAAENNSNVTVVIDTEEKK